MNGRIASELPHVKTLRLPVSWTVLALTYGLIFSPSKVWVFISTGVYSLMRSTGIFIYKS
jgi:hypothetical protein